MTKQYRSPDYPHTKSRVRFSNKEKVFFPKAGFKKADLIFYYQTVAKVMLPYLKDRPHSLLRQPDGIKGESFFQKDMDHMPPGWIKTIPIYSEPKQKDINYLVCDSVDSLLYMVQLGCIEINPWNSRTAKLQYPDWAVLDLDPEGAGFDLVIEVSLAARKVLERLDIASYPKTSGRSGMHLYIPLGAKYNYDQARQFARILANIIHRQTPEATSLERSPKKRRKKIYIDFLQNRQGQTLAAPYSVRPTAEASVSTPLRWDEVTPRLKPSDFTIANFGKRLDKVGDIWRPVLGEGVDMKSALSKVSDTTKM